MHEENHAIYNTLSSTSVTNSHCAAAPALFGKGSRVVLPSGHSLLLTDSLGAVYFVYFGEPSSLLPMTLKAEVCFPTLPSIIWSSRWAPLNWEVSVWMAFL